MSKQQEILDLVNNWLKFAEAKNAVVIALAGTALFNLLKVLSASDLHLATYIYLIQLVICLLFSLIVALASFVPITDYLVLLPKAKITDTDNLLFFGHLAKYTKEDLISKFNEFEENETIDQYKEMYIEQIIINSRIAMSKYYYFNQSIVFIFWGILSPLFGPVAIKIIKKYQRSVTKSV